MSTAVRRKVRRVDEAPRRRHERLVAATVGRTGLWPLNAPGMPPPGPDFLAAARHLGDDTVYDAKKRASKGKKGDAAGDPAFAPGSILTELYRRALREPGFSLTVKVREGFSGEVAFVPGHIWGQHAAAWMRSQDDPTVMVPPVDGPHPAEVMILGKMPWIEEAQERRNLVGASGAILSDLIRKAHLDGMSWYVTNLVKFKPPDEGTTLKAGWIADCKPLLHQELRIVRPKYILCLGADATKALLGPSYTVGYMEGRVVPFEFPVHLAHDDEPEFHRCQVMTVLHPAEAAREPAKARIIERGVGRFALLVSGVDFDRAEEGLDHRLIDTYEDAVEWAAEVEAELAARPRRDRLVAWDAEWQGQHPGNRGSYLRTIQVAWAPKKAVCFKITHAGGKRAFRDAQGRPALKRLAKLLNRFMGGKRAVGHFLVSDLEWLNHYGIDPVASCEVPLDPRKGKAAWERLRGGEGWLDTAMMRHAIEETAPLGLEAVAMHYTTAPRYDIPMEDWIKKYCSERKITRAALEGYGDAPDDVLVSYACYDADVTLRAARQLLPLLDCDYEGNCCWEPFWESMIALPVILEMHQNGVQVDRRRVDRLTEVFLTAKAALEEKIRDWAEWPEFNIRSHFEVREFLFGERLNGKFDARGRSVRLRPPGARSLHVTPLLDTSKPPRRWEDLRAKGLERQATPGTGKSILSILAQENQNVGEQIGWIRDHRFLDQVLKSVLRPPLVDADDGSWLVDDDGLYAYDKGLAAAIDDDGRVRTHLYPTAETGRWKSARPNLQNISKSRDADYVRILGDRYKQKLRSILVARPGWALVEFDYTGAELYGMALLSGDAKMIEHSERALLPDEGFDAAGNEQKGGKHPHPRYYDIHSNVAVLAFQLTVNDHVYEKKNRQSPDYGKTASELLGLPVGAPCPANKRALKIIGKTHFRTLAKNVIFGIAYGRGAKAIALQAREQGVKVSPDEAQQVIDAIFAMYPRLEPFFEAAKARATGPRWLANCWGRLRRFLGTDDRTLEGGFERQAMNFPVQSLVASAVDRGLARLRRAIRDAGLRDDVKMLLQIHDAGLLEVRHEHVAYVTEHLIPYAMRDCVPIYPTRLDGTPTGAGPYYLGLDITVHKAWGEPYTGDECERFGLPAKYARSA